MGALTGSFTAALEERDARATLRDARLQGSRDEGDAGADVGADDAGGLGGAPAAARFDGSARPTPGARVALWRARDP